MLWGRLSGVFPPAWCRRLGIAYISGSPWVVCVLWFYLRFRVNKVWFRERGVYSRSGLTCLIHHFNTGSVKRRKERRLEGVIIFPSHLRSGLRSGFFR